MELKEAFRLAVDVAKVIPLVVGWAVIFVWLWLRH